MTTPRQPGPRYGTQPRGVPAPSYPTPSEPPTEPPADPPEQGYGPPDEGYPTEPSEPTEPTEPPPARRCPPSTDCDTGAIDELRCEAAGKLAEAAEITASAAALDARQKAFETIRKTYSTARDAAALAVDALDARLKTLTPKLRCELHKDRADCVDRAFDEVIACVEECTGGTGCGIAEDCGFTGETWTAGQIDELRARVEKVEKYFDDVLLKEPDALTARVAAVQKLVDDLDAAKKAGTETDERLYARAKEARWWLDGVWGAFADVNEFRDCLCRGINCSLQGRKLLSELVGDKAFQDCQAASRLARCTWLRNNIVDETIAVVLRICPPAGSDYRTQEPA